MPPAQAAADRGRPGGGAQTAPRGGQGRGGSSNGGATKFKTPRPQQAAAKGARGREGEADEAREAGHGEHNSDSYNSDNKRREKGRGGADSDGSGEDSQEEEDAADDDEEDTVSIPPELLTRILHHFFQKPNTRMTLDANTAMSKYMEIFVREAVARSMAERREGGFLDVGVLQKVAAQLIMDM